MCIAYGRIELSFSSSFGRFLLPHKERNLKHWWTILIRVFFSVYNNAANRKIILFADYSAVSIEQKGFERFVRLFVPSILIVKTPN